MEDKSYTWITVVMILVGAAFTSAGRVKPPVLVKQPDQSILYKESVLISMECECLSNPQPRFYWEKNGRRLDVDKNENFSWKTMSQGTLVINEPGKQDGGVYQCFCYNSLGTAATPPTTLTTAKLESFPTVDQSKHLARLGSPLMLKCNAPASVPKARILWQLIQDYPFESIKIVNENRRIGKDDQGNLYFTNIEASDGVKDGRYVCVARNKFLRSWTQGEDHILKVTGGIPVSGAPKLIWSTPAPYTGLLNQRFQLKCLFSGFPTPTIKWRRLDKPLTARVTVSASGHGLFFSAVQYQDEGTYECEGRNSQSDTPTRKLFTLRVEAPPTWVVTPSNKNVAEESSTYFLCKATGKPVPTVEVFVNGKPLADTRSSRRRLVAHGNLTFVNLMKKDSQVIQCKATNQHGFIYHNAFLNVLAEPPTWRYKPLDQLKAAIGQTVNLTCQTYAAPLAGVSWTRGTAESAIPLRGDRYRIYSDGNLQIANVTEHDGGLYECIAKNKLGQLVGQGGLGIRRPTQITVRPVDSAIRAGQSAAFQCLATTDSREKNNLQIKWLKNNQQLDPSLIHNINRNSLDNSITITDAKMVDTATYTCLATNGIDTARANAQLRVQDVPNPPKQLQIDCDTREKERVAIITWDEAQDNFSPIVLYQLEYETTSSQGVWLKISSRGIRADGPRRTEFQMSPWMTYTFRIIAINRLGSSQPSPPAPRKCTTAPAKPDQVPRNVRIESSRRDNIIIRWDPMTKSAENGPGFQYVIHWNCIDTSCKDKKRYSGVHKIRDAARRDLVIDNQPTYKRYSVIVTCENVMGTSTAPVERVHGYSGEDVPTVAPSSFKVLSHTVTATNATFTWSAVPNDPEQIRGFFMGYRIQYWRESEGYESRLETNVLINKPNRLQRRQGRETIQKKVMDIPSFTTVVAQVVVINTRYAGPPSRQIKFLSKEGVPDEVSVLEVSFYGPDWLEVQWAPPRYKNGVLTSYEVAIAHVKNGREGNRKWEPVITNPMSRRHRIIDLVPRQQYRVFVYALSRMGRGKERSITIRTTHDGPPIPPTFEVNNIGDTSFNVSWTPSTTGNPGSIFFVQYRSTGETEWKTTNSENAVQRWKTVSDLLPGTSYHVRMLVRDANNQNDRASAFDTITTTGMAAVADIYTAGWFVAMMCVVALLVVVIVIVCILKRNRNGGKYSGRQGEQQQIIELLKNADSFSTVHEKERLRTDTIDNGGFGDSKNTATDNGRPFLPTNRPGSGESTDKQQVYSESADSLAEYVETNENNRFCEEGSFIGQYGGRRVEVTPDFRTPRALSTFV